MQVDRRTCQQFQNGLSYEKIDRIWRVFREAGNSHQGKITKSVYMKIMMKNFYKSIPGQEQSRIVSIFLEKLFERFRFEHIHDKQNQKDRNDKDKNQKQQHIDLQDFVIGLVLISLIPFIDKVKYIFYLTDLDEGTQSIISDGCLGLQEIQNMIERIEKIFCRENSSAKVQSFSLLVNNAHKKAQRNYSSILFLLYKNNPGLKNDQGGLITGQQFIQALSGSYDLYHEQKFLPLNISLAEIIGNTTGQLTIRITEDSKQDFMKFRKELYMILQKNKDGNKDVIKYPWKVEIVKQDKTAAGQLPQTQKIIEKQKRSQKQINKTKAYKHDFKELYDKKNTEQNLQAYRLKVKKMIQTKQDPRLSIKFDKTVRK